MYFELMCILFFTYVTFTLSKKNRKSNKRETYFLDISLKNSINPYFNHPKLIKCKGVEHFDKYQEFNSYSELISRLNLNNRFVNLYFIVKNNFIKEHLRIVLKNQIKSNRFYIFSLENFAQKTIVPSCYNYETVNSGWVSTNNTVTNYNDYSFENLLKYFDITNESEQTLENVYNYLVKHLVDDYYQEMQFDSENTITFEKINMEIQNIDDLNSKVEEEINEDENTVVEEEETTIENVSEENNEDENTDNTEEKNNEQEENDDVVETPSDEIPQSEEESQEDLINREYELIKNMRKEKLQYLLFKYYPNIVYYYINKGFSN